MTPEISTVLTILVGVFGVWYVVRQQPTVNRGAAISFDYIIEQLEQERRDKKRLEATVEVLERRVRELERKQAEMRSENQALRTILSERPL